MYNRRNVCVHYQTDTDDLIIVVFRYRKNTYLKDSEMELYMTKREKLPSQRVYLLSCYDIFFKRCLVLDETTVRKQNKLHQEWLFSA